MTKKFAILIAVAIATALVGLQWAAKPAKAAEFENLLAPHPPTWERVDANPLLREEDIRFDAKRDAYYAARWVYRIDPNAETAKAYEASMDVYEAELDSFGALLKALKARIAVEDLLDVAATDPVKKMMLTEPSIEEYRWKGTINPIAFVSRIEGDMRWINIMSWWAIGRDSSSTAFSSPIE